MPRLYNQVLESVVLPVYYSVRGRRYGQYRRFLEHSQWWSRDRLLAYQWEQLRSLLQHAFSSVPYYQQKYRAAGIRLEDIRTRGDFAQLPPLTREELNEHRRDLCSTAFHGKLLPKSTGGSSGVPAHFFITTDSFDWRTAATSRAYSWCGCYLGEPTLYLWGAPVGKQSVWQGLKVGAYHRLRRELVFSTFVQNPELWDRVYRTALRFRPKYLVGYVSSLEHFGGYLLETQRRVPGLRSVLAAAEPVYPATRERIERAYGVPLCNTYGSREFMSIAAECECHQGLHINCENVLAEVKEPLFDGPSELLITDLHNYGMPFIRYAIGDLGKLTTRMCACGRGLPQIESLCGRTLDVIRCRDGRIVPGEVFPHLMKEIPEVKEFQVSQVATDRVVLSVVLLSPLSNASHSLIRRELEVRLGSGTSLTVQRVESIPRLGSGKRRVTIGLEASA